MKIELTSKRFAYIFHSKGLRELVDDDDDFEIVHNGGGDFDPADGAEPEVEALSFGFNRG